MSGPVATARPPQALRLRRESQRPGVARTATRPANMEGEPAKQDTRRYVQRAADVLAKHKDKPPSLRIFLHPKHFRINDSPDMLEYESPMRELLSHVKTRTVPHNMVEDFYAAEIPFYDNCLIVEIHDHRSNGVKPRDDTNSLGDSGKSAFSIHNYNNFITPSPFAPYPSSNKDAKPGQAEAKAKDIESKDDKENMPAPAQNGAPQKPMAKNESWKVVLFPTPQSHLADMQLLATTPMPDLAMLKRMQAAGRSGTMPPTPMTGVPPTPTFSNGPSPKRQKMVLDESNVHEFEAEVLNATCPKLFLEPTKSFGESLAIMDAITHPNHKNEAPPRKTRKRTTAELQADEAEAAATQRFMLAGDEQQANMATTATGGDEGQVRSTANTQTFARFKTLATIKANHEEADRRKKEEDARIAQAKRQAQIEAEAQRKRDLESNKQQAEVHERQQQLLRQQAAQQQQLQQNQMLQNEALRAATQAQQMANATAAQIAQTPQSATQPQFSPVVRNGTPMAAAANSPRVGGQVSHPMGGTPMVASASNHAINSPARPPSAVSHQQMARSVSQQQNMSRTGTPQMVQGTPVMNTAMPNRNMTPTPARMSQSSPSMAMQGGTPIMMQTPQPGQTMTPEHMQQLQNQQMQQRMLQQQRINQNNASPGVNQLQQLAIQKATQYMQQHGIPQGQNPQHYQQTLARRFFSQLQQSQLAAQQTQQQQSMQMSPQPSQQGMNPNNMNLAQLRQHHQARKMQLLQQYGQQIPQQEMMRLTQLERVIQSRQQAEQQSQMQLMNPGMQNQMQTQMQAQMNGLPNQGQNPMQMQQYQQLLQQQRANQARQQQIMAMRQQAMQQGGQIPQGMMNNVNMQGMNMGNMQGMNMQNMQGMNMQNMQNMQAMQGMQGMNVNGMNQQQVQQMMMMRAQQQAQRMGQPGQQGGDMSGWTG
ncbi:Spt20 family-domain-containing protein [Paraphoma chrysanthemicola]|uniref:Spt20 family-domain-containing protein n=1 Tax=Paraphoma chrysanthemicola TaxID=798071 RepID=A0A8K0R0M3_9PLEO|nr:Spt20 family-domain-containing protein [Paraphoma chrysanthemicola]